MRIKALPIKTSLPPVPVGLVTVMGRTLTPLTERFIEYARKVASHDLGRAAARGIWCLVLARRDILQRRAGLVAKRQAALPISADIAALARVGLDAVAAIESGRPPDTQLARARKRNSSIVRPWPKRLQKAPCRCLPRNNSHLPTFCQASASLWKLR